MRGFGWRAHPLATIGIFILLTLGPFLNKAVHIDDSLFVWTAEQILKHPGDFYGFDVNWYGQTVPMSVENCNPPATSYFLAGVMAVFGEREMALHAAMLLVAFAAAAGIFQLAKIWCERPLLATFIAMSTPVFLVSATTLMCDVPMLAVWIWAVVFWERALKNGKAFYFFLAATARRLVGADQIQRAPAAAAAANFGRAAKTQSGRVAAVARRAGGDD